MSRGLCPATTRHALVRPRPCLILPRTSNNASLLGSIPSGPPRMPHPAPPFPRRSPPTTQADLSSVPTPAWCCPPAPAKPQGQGQGSAPGQQRWPPEDWGWGWAIMGTRLASGAWARSRDWRCGGWPGVCGVGGLTCAVDLGTGVRQCDAMGLNVRYVAPCR